MCTTFFVLLSGSLLPSPWIQPQAIYMTNPFLLTAFGQGFEKTESKQRGMTAEAGGVEVLGKGHV